VLDWRTPVRIPPNPARGFKVDTQLFCLFFLFLPPLPFDLQFSRRLLQSSPLDLLLFRLLRQFLFTLRQNADRLLQPVLQTHNLCLQPRLLA